MSNRSKALRAIRRLCEVPGQLIIELPDTVRFALDELGAVEALGELAEHFKAEATRKRKAAR